ncbi:hypothetical protein KIPE111705_45480 [Kibdelosporangium persicum]
MPHRQVVGEVLELRLGLGRATSPGVLGHRSHDILVEPVESQILVTRLVPEHRIAPHLVVVRRWQVRRRALPGQVLGLGETTRLVDDPRQPVTGDRNDSVVARVHSVGQRVTRERHLRQSHRPADMTGPGDTRQPQRLRRTVHRRRELLPQRPRIHVVETAAVLPQRLRDDLGQPLAGEERRRVTVRAVLASVADPIKRNIRPVHRSVLGQLPRITRDHTAGQAPLRGVEHHLSGRFGHQRVLPQAVLDPGQPVRRVVLGVHPAKAIALVEVGFLVVVERHRVAARIDHQIDVPSVGLHAHRVRVRWLVARFARMVAVHRHGQHRVRRLRLAALGSPPGQPVEAEEVLRAVDRGDLPMFALVAVGESADLLDLGTVVLLRPQQPVASLDQLAGHPAERDRVPLVLPAHVAGLLVALVAPGLVDLTCGIGPLHEAARGQLPALTHPRGLVVGRRSPAVHTTRGVRERQLRRRTTWRRRQRHRHRIGEVTAGIPRAPGTRRRQAARAVVTGRPRRGGSRGDHCALLAHRRHVGGQLHPPCVVLRRQRCGDLAFRFVRCGQHTRRIPLERQPRSIVVAVSVTEAAVVQADRRGLALARGRNLEHRACHACLRRRVLAQSLHRDLDITLRGHRHRGLAHLLRRGPSSRVHFRLLNGRPHNRLDRLLGHRHVRQRIHFDRLAGDVSLLLHRRSRRVALSR